jgi:hypothetical protein
VTPRCIGTGLLGTEQVALDCCGKIGGLHRVPPTTRPGLLATSNEPFSGMLHVP